MFQRLRSSFAAKLLAGSIVLALITVGSVAGYLLYSRDSQTRAGALSNSDNRVEVMREVLEQFTGAQSYRTAAGLAAQTPLASALLQANAAKAVAALFAGSAPVDIASEVLVISDASGRPLYARAAPDLVGVNITDFESTSAIRAALANAVCGVTRAAGACGVEVLSGGIPAYSVAVPVRLGAVGQTIGVVAYVAPLAQELHRFAQLFQFPTAFIPAANPRVELRQTGGAEALGATPSSIASGIDAHADLVHATYNAPAAGGASEGVAGSFVAVDAPDGRALAGYLGIEVPLSSFVGDEATDELTLALITVFVLLLLTLLILVFVEVVVRRPIHRLERGVARIAGGDYTSPVEVRSRDELGRLATGVNRMRDSIRTYTTEIESARQRLDSAVERVGNVSRALTSTTGGVVALQREVVRSAAGIAGGGAAALLAVREGDALAVSAVHPDDATASLEGWPGTAEVLKGGIVRDAQPGGSMLAIPMFYQDRVVGALCVVSPATDAEFASDEEDVLVVLANNAAVAMENARLFEQERETVQRLRQLDAMKNDFLATVQHELRTPLTAILGLSDLLEMCWETWEDTPKLDALHDIQVAARNLYDIVETIIDFSAVDSETLDIKPTAVPVADTVQQAIVMVSERYRDGLPVPVDVAVDPSLRILADADRFAQVMRAVIDNAVKFSDGAGGVLVSAEVAGEEVSISVADSGIGIAEDDIPRIFERFYQVDNSATRRYGGTGMGLALVKRLVDAHGASVAVTSELGSGTTVTVRWPRAAGGGAADGRDGAAGSEATDGVEAVTEPVPAAPVAPVQ